MPPIVVESVVGSVVENVSESVGDYDRVCGRVCGCNDDCECVFVWTPLGASPHGGRTEMMCTAFAIMCVAKGDASVIIPNGNAHGPMA